MSIEVRDYRSEDEAAWLRCRVLSFLNTAYYDDVCTSKPAVGSGAELVARDDGTLVGLLDLSVEAEAATIDTIAVHPDYQGRGVGGTLLRHAVGRAAAAGATTIEAWTRDDDQALRWYTARGFTQDSHYLHVYADYYVSPDEPDRAVERRPGLSPIRIFLHAPIGSELQMRRQFSRVHVCRRFTRPV